MKYNVYIKQYNKITEDSGKMEIVYTGSISNCDSFMLECSADIIIGLRGELVSPFRKNHPESTRDYPVFYGIPQAYKVDIYHHKKSVGWLFSTHTYEKLYTIKILPNTLKQEYVTEHRNSVSDIIKKKYDSDIIPLLSG